MKIKNVLVALSFGLGLLAAPLIALADPGDLDTTFSADGKVTTAIGSHDDEGWAVAIQSDGKIVVAGFSNNGSNEDFALARYNSNGSPDTSFSTDGKVITPIGSEDDKGYAVAIQSDGKIVVAGFSDNGSNEDFALARYNSNGSLDTTFGSSGIVSTDISTNDDKGYAVAIQSDGKIVVAGRSWNGSDNDFALARYNSNGNLDNTFGSDGIVTTDDTNNKNDYGRAVVIQSDGKIVLAGYIWNTDIDFALVRYSSNGSLDTTFGSSGIVSTDISTNDDYGWAVAIQSDDKIVVAGYSYMGSNFNDFALARYNSNGSLDTTFGTGGIVTTPIGNSFDYARGVAIQSDGKIVAAGYVSQGSGKDFALARYNSDGSLDTTFGTGGIVITPIDSNADFGNAVTIQSDGKIVVAGTSSNTNNADFALVRYKVASSSTQTIANGGGSATLEDVVITNNSDYSCDFTVTRHPVPPGGAPADAGEMPMQWNITSSGCGTLNVDLVFSYSDTELVNGNNIIEGNLKAFKSTGSSTWTDQCTTFTCSLNTIANTLSVTGVDSLSTWTLGDNSGSNHDPTAITLRDFTAHTDMNISVVLSLGLLGMAVIGLAVRRWRTKSSCRWSYVSPRRGR